MVDWQGEWITSGEDGPVAPLLRREFVVPPGVVRGRLHIAGLGLHRTTLNGQPVTDARLESGLTAYDKTVLYSSYDVELRPGPATVGVELGRGFYALTTPNVWRWEQAPWRALRQALVQLELLDGNDQVVEVVGSDEQWSWAPGPTRFDSYYEGETFDAGAEPTGWDSPGFDAGGWSAVELTEAPAGRLAPRAHEPVRVVDTLEVVRWLGGGDQALVADFGLTLAGWAEISTGAVPAGTTIDLRYGEQLKPDGTVDAENHLVYSDRFDVDRLVVGDQPVSWEPRFSYKGFRYVQVDGLADPAAITLRARHAHNDVASVSTFTCSDEVLSWID
ncbi:MAG: family 78 glycoside hydrolase catalytic domain, partial [Propionibacteriaceae bacterium]